MKIKYWSKLDKERICSSIIRVVKEYGLYRAFKSKFPSRKKLYDEITKTTNIEGYLVNSVWSVAYDNFLKTIKNNNNPYTPELLSSICILDLAKILYSFNEKRFENLTSLIVSGEFNYIFNVALIDNGNKWKKVCNQEVVKKITNHYELFKNMIAPKHSKHFV